MTKQNDFFSNIIRLSILEMLLYPKIFIQGWSLLGYCLWNIIVRKENFFDLMITCRLVKWIDFTFRTISLSKVIQIVVVIFLKALKKKRKKSCRFLLLLLYLWNITLFPKPFRWLFLYSFRANRKLIFLDETNSPFLLFFIPRAL